MSAVCTYLRVYLRPAKEELYSYKFLYHEMYNIIAIDFMKKLMTYNGKNIVFSVPSR